MDGFPGVRNYGVVDPDDLYDVYCYAEDLNGEGAEGESEDELLLCKSSSSPCLALWSLMHGGYRQGEEVAAIPLSKHHDGPACVQSPKQVTGNKLGSCPLNLLCRMR